MSRTIPIEEAAGKLPELVRMMSPGDEIILTSDDRAVARIVSNRAASRPRRAGGCKGMLVIHEDDDAHLRDFQDYM